MSSEATPMSAESMRAVWGDEPPSAAATPGQIGYDDVRRAAELLAGIAHRTPALTSRSIDGFAGTRVFLKCENLQRSGAFKFRGAYNALAGLERAARDAGVLAYSSGNHAQAVALAGRLLNVPTVIVMPSDAPEIKLRATRAYQAGTAGSEVITYDRARLTREAIGRQLAEERSLTVVPPYDHPDVIAGQGTAAMELFEDVGPLDALYVCCGGGGLLSGSCLAASGLAPGCRVIGVEPALADDAARSFETGVLHEVRNPQTIADGARTPFLGRWTFPLVRRLASGVRTVSEREIASAMRVLAERTKLVVEPAGALALAGLLADARRGADIGARVGVLVSGGNVDVARLGELSAQAGEEVFHD